jgi:hypothetical protein
MGLCDLLFFVPTACAVGCILTPLCGWVCWPPFRSLTLDKLWVPELTCTPRNRLRQIVKEQLLLVDNAILLHLIWCADAGQEKTGLGRGLLELFCLM